MPTLFYRDPDTGDFKPVLGGANQHGNLEGLDGDDHPQYVQKAQNLADLTNANAARGNLGLGNAATANTGTGPFDVAIGDHAHEGQPKITASTGAPTGGEDGDVWLVYT